MAQHACSGKNACGPGTTGKDFKEVDDLNPGRIEKSWPDSGGFKESLPPISKISIDRMKKD